MIILDEPAQVYHANPAVSFHRLLVAERCPLLYYQRFVAKTAADEKKETAALNFGRAAHVAILEGEARFKSEYLWCEEKIDGRTKEGKALTEYLKAEAKGRTVLKWEDVQLIRTMTDSVRANPDAARLLETGSPEVTVRVHHDSHNLTCQGRLDWVSGEGHRIDLKTCSTIDEFRRDVEQRKYYAQLSFYRSLMCLEQGREALDKDDYLIAVEKEAPYRAQVFKLSAVYLDFGEAENEAALAKLAECYATDTWPSGVEGVTELGPSQRLAERHAATATEGAFV